MRGDTEGPAEHEDEVQWEEFATVKSVAHFWPLGDLIGDSKECVTHWHGRLLFAWIVKGDNKQGGASSSPLLSCPFPRFSSPGLSVISHP